MKPIGLKADTKKKHICWIVNDLIVKCKVKQSKFILFITKGSVSELSLKQYNIIE